MYNLAFKLNVNYRNFTNAVMLILLHEIMVFVDEKIESAYPAAGIYIKYNFSVAMRLSGISAERRCTIV
jgi:hypothetical protein